MNLNKKAMSDTMMIVVGAILAVLILLIFTGALGKIPGLLKGSEPTCEKTYGAVCVAEDEQCPGDMAELVTSAGCADGYKCCAPPDFGRG